MEFILLIITALVAILALILSLIALISKKKDDVLDINIKYFDKEMPKLEKIEKGNWIDLRSAVSIEFKKGDFIKVPLGIAMELPKNHEAYVVPRGSTFKNFGTIIVNSPGVVDESFRGDNDQWHAFMYALRDGKIEKYERIAQFRIAKSQPVIRFHEKDFFDGHDRGMQGSTGTK